MSEPDSGLVALICLVAFVGLIAAPLLWGVVFK